MAEFEAVDFRDHILVPASTFENTLTLHHGWLPVDAELGVDCMRTMVVDGIDEFLGDDNRLPFEADRDAIAAWVEAKASEYTVYGLFDVVVDEIYGRMTARKAA